MDDATTSLVILALVVVVFVWNRLPVGAVAVLTALALYVTGVLDAEQALAGFGDPVVVFIATLFVVSEGIDSSGVTTWAGQALIRRAGDSRNALLVAVTGLAAVLTALITLNGSVAALLPVVVVLAVRIGEPPSNMLMPLAFAGSAGGLLALTGSPVNVIVSEALSDATGEGFEFFEFAIVGVPLVVGTIAICLLLGPRVLPATRPAGVTADLSRHSRTLGQHYALTNGFYRLRVRERSPLLGTPVDAIALADYPGVRIVGAQHSVGTAVVREPLAVDDVLVVAGSADEIRHLVIDQGLAVSMEPVTGPDGLLTAESGVVEVVVPPRSDLVGETVFPGMVRRSGVVVLAVRRVGRDRGERSTELLEGDALLVYGDWSALDHLVQDRDVLVVDSPDVIRRQAVAWGPKALRAVVVLAAMVVLLAFDLVPPAIAGLLAAVAMVLSRVAGVQQAYKAVSWQTVVLIGGLIPLSTAIQTSGAADRIADVIIDAVGSGQPYLLMLALFVLTATLGQVVSNTATVLIVTPIAVSAAAATGTSAEPVLMLIAVAGAAALLTPIATPANMMIMAPAGYRFGDYWKLGLPVLLWWLLVALVVIPLVWGF